MRNRKTGPASLRDKPPRRTFKDYLAEARWAERSERNLTNWRKHGISPKQFRRNNA